MVRISQRELQSTMVAYPNERGKLKWLTKPVKRPAASAAERQLQEDVLKTLLYFDIFDFPLRLPEISQYLPTDTVALADLRHACSLLTFRNLVSEKDGYYFLRERPHTIVEARLEKERRARRVWPVASLVARMVGLFPFVKGVFISGELSKGVASKNSDIDFYIVTAPRRVWIVRSICAVFKRVFLLNSRRFFCYNHIVSDECFEVSEKSLYAAMELVTLVPMWNKGLYEAILGSNPWVATYLPNWRNQRKLPQSRSFNMPVLERLLGRLIASQTLDDIDEHLRRRWAKAWNDRYPEFADAKRRELFQCTPQLSTSYVRDFSGKVLTEYRKRLYHFGLLTPDVNVTPSETVTAEADWTR